MTPLDGRVPESAAAGFSAGADDYERGRPSYPADAVGLLCRELAIGPGARVLDLAAGTGKLTRLLVPTGAEVVAVEPVAEMRERLRANVPSAMVLDGTAERLPLPDASVDAVTVAQAFHWFDAEAALREIAWVLRPGGGLGLIWNERDTREPWVAELSRLIRWDERGEHRVPYTTEVDWAARIDGLDVPFGPVRRHDTTYRQPMDPDTLVARVLSTSYIASRPTAERERLAVKIRELVADLGDTFDLPYETVVYWCRREV
ncbi:methyltransferase domain-containing protein [Iamia sp. SCSIO 61187]|uniref:class I SAM-dependent methyltransferase n=1 Tax=Iamia sp. SCSIO 61187 TaxID=2722752 RepID=UPI001C63A302|nr:class I SAM-dependent methyltransferase [Iamia sp. SCSIO 61187]QYG93972.1 methyltransferase domain-containing protein [Iamia sp. SCSIO 61187]